MPGEPPLDKVIRNTGKNVAILVVKVHNLQHEIQELRSSNDKLRSVVLTLLADPQAREDALAVLKEWGVSNHSQVKNHHR